MWRPVGRVSCRVSGFETCVAANTNANTKYTCDTGQTRNKLLQRVHLTNHTAGRTARMRDAEDAVVNDSP